MAQPVPEVARELEARVDGLGFELVDVEWAGSRRRPILRLRIDRPGSGVGPGADGVNLDDCAVVSRALEAWLDEMAAVPERYVLEVSSPGVERPLVRPSDYSRFAGQQVAVKGERALAGRARRLEGELLGLDESDAEQVMVRLRLPGGDEVAVPLAEITGGHIVYRWS